MNHLSLLHQPLSLSGIQHICFLQKALLKGVLINLSGREGTPLSLKPFVKKRQTYHFIPLQVIIPKKKQLYDNRLWNVAHY